MSRRSGRQCFSRKKKLKKSWKKGKKEMIDDCENEIQVNVVGNIFDNPEIREAQK